jgi:predicted dehydrogenase
VIRLTLQLATKRVAPGETNTWLIEIDGTEGSIAFSTKTPKTLRWMEYTPGSTQPWLQLDLGTDSAYPTITGGIFEFGFSDAILQMWAAFLDELAHREDMHGPFRCATVEETTVSHRVFTAALRSDRERRYVALSEIA